MDRIFANTGAFGLGVHSMRVGRRIAWPALVTLAVTVFADNALAQDPASRNIFAGQPLQLRKTLEIQAAAVGNPALTAPRAVSADSQYIYVLDPTTYGVHRFDRRGTWLGNFGKQGDGPGEFRRPSGMGWRADTLWIADSSLGRLSFFDRTGAFLRSTSFRSVTGPALAVPQRAFGASIASSPYVPLASTSSVDSVPILLFSDDGSSQDTLAWTPLGQAAVSITIPRTIESRSQVVTIPHSLDLRSLVAHDPKSRWLYLGSWRTDSRGDSVLEVIRVTASQDTTATMRLPLRRTAIPLYDLRSYAAALYDGLSETIGTKFSVNDLIEAFRRQVKDPVATDVDAMLASEDGTIWLRRSSWMHGDRREQWVSLTPSGELVGLIELPEGHALLAVTEGLLWTIREGNLGLPVLTGLAIVSPKEGSG